MKEKVKITIGTEVIEGTTNVNGDLDIDFNVSAKYTSDGQAPTNLSVSFDGVKTYDVVVGIENGFEMDVQTFQAENVDNVIVILKNKEIQMETVLNDLMRGDSRSYSFTLFNDDGDPNAVPVIPNTPFDLDGYILTMSFKRNKSDTKYLAQVIGVITGVDNNIAQFNLGASKSKNLCEGLNYWDAEIKKPSLDIRKTIGYGTINVITDITI